MVENVTREKNFNLKKNINKNKKVGNVVKARKIRSVTIAENKKALDKRLEKRAINPLKKIDIEKEDTTFGKRRIRALVFNWPDDVIYRSPWVNKLTNKLMKAGQKSKAEQIVNRFMSNLNQTCRGNPYVIFHEVLESLKPALTVVTRRVGRRFYQVPVPVKTLRQHTLALSWVLAAVKENPQVQVSDLLTDEFIGAYFSTRSESLRKKEHLYQTVIKNRAFNHYRWI